METPNAKDILNRYLDGKCTEQEIALLESSHLDYDLDAVENIDFDAQVKDLDQVWARLEAPEPVVRRTKLWPGLAVAAAVMLIGGLGLFFYQQRSSAEKEQHELAAAIHPGTNDAFLTLSNGL